MLQWKHDFVFLSESVLESYFCVGLENFLLRNLKNVYALIFTRFMFYQKQQNTFPFPLENIY